MRWPGVVALVLAVGALGILAWLWLVLTFQDVSRALAVVHETVPGPGDRRDMGRVRTDGMPGAER